MAEKDINVVISGKYEGYELRNVEINAKKWVYLAGEKQVVRISVDSVQSVDAVNGVESLVKITWKFGGESVIKVSTGMYDNILACSYRSGVTPEEIAQADARTHGPLSQAAGKGCGLLGFAIMGILLIMFL